MTAVRNLASRNYRNGAVYYDWYPISSSWLPNYIGHFDQANFVTVIRFNTDSYASSISFSWTTTEQYYGNGTVKYKLLDSEDASLNNANASTAADGSFTARQSGYGRNTLTINRTIAPGTHYLYLWQGVAGEHFTSIYWGSGGDYGVTFEYNAIAGTASTITAVGSVLGQPITVQITRNNTQFVHTLGWSFAGRSGSIVQRTNQLVVSWTPDAEEFSAYIPNAVSSDMVISCTTFIGNEQIGTPQTATLTMSVPADRAPEVAEGWAEVGYTNEGTAAQGIDACIQGFSIATVRFDDSKVSAKYGASIAALKAKLGAKEITGSGNIATVGAGDNTITLSAVDTRGVTTTQTVTVTAYEYSLPRLSNVRIERCDSTGSAADDGAFVGIFANVEYSSAGGAISCRLYGQIKTPQGEWGGQYDVTPGEVTTIGGALAVDSSYVARVVAEDSLGGEASVEAAIPTASCAFNLREGGDGAGFGKYGEVENALDMGWDIQMNGRRVTGLAAPTESSDAVTKEYADGTFAPAGYGLGTDAVIVDSWDNAIANGFYTSDNGGAIEGTWFYGIVHSYDDGGSWVIQKAWCNEKDGRFCSAERRKTTAGWTAWEWVNPPMAVGVEYRTTERFNGKAVYAKLINFGAMPNATIKQVAHGINGLEYVTHLSGTTPGYYFPSDIANAAVGAVDLYMNRQYVLMTCDTDWSAYECLISIKYTKE